MIVKGSPLLPVAAPLAERNVASMVTKDFDSTLIQGARFAKARLAAVALLAVGGLASCTPRQSVTPSSELASSEVTAANDTAAPAMDGAATVNRETISVISPNTLGIDRLSSANGSTYEISSRETITNVETFTASNPPRFVVDLKGAPALSSASLPVTNDSSVSAIRIGKRPDGSRIVFDLASATTPTIEQTPTGILVNFGQGQAPVAATGYDAPVTSEVAAPAYDSQPTARLEALTFEKAPTDSGKVILNVSGEPKYNLRQSTPTEYVLTLNNSAAADAAMAPQIAQPGSVLGLRVVRAAQAGDDVQLRMFVDAGTTLSTKRTTRGLIVTAQPPAVSSEARAQLAEAPKDEKTVTTTVNDPTAKVVEGDDEAARRNPTGIPSADGSKAYTGRLISLDLQETDIDNALRIIAEVSNLNIIASDDVTGKVTLRLIDVPWDQALDVILKTNGLDQVTEGNVIRIAPVDKLRQEREALREAKKAAENLEDLKVKYIRVSYARASELKEQVEAVLSERGTATVDERTNQLIVKDIMKGQDETLQLIKKLDLRTPQVLLETQIVEAARNLLRDLGFQWNFSYSQSPQTGNATGNNFPNSIVVGGAAASGAGLQAINFPAAIGANSGSGIAAILDSADGSRALAMRLTALEQEGKVRVISRPQVATVNNKEAEIKSVETIRIKTPNSGLAVATGGGASASGGGATAFQEVDVGITLKVTPQASPDYFVLLDVNAKSSTFGSNAVDGIPSTLERQATSTILVKSGQTFALGGVYRVNDQDRLEGLPFFKDIPVLGHFFRRTFTDKRDEELIFFITPHIVEGSFDPSLM